MSWTPPDWTVTVEGPSIEALLRHIAECPADFLGEPMDVDGRGEVHVGAVVSDLLSALGGRMLTPMESNRFCLQQSSDKKQRNRLRCALVAAHALAFFRGRSAPGFDPRAAAENVRGFMLDGLDDFAPHVNASQLVADADRREETARTMLRALGLRPRGETVAVAQDRLTTMSSAERQRVLRESRAADERNRKVLEEARRKAEAEAAATYSGE
ncbi:MAG: hypothetical protein EB084_09760 [Proteobacteria bacterium]|nr:hypothetical protein [Pseudomonadota bacterium]